MPVAQMINIYLRGIQIQADPPASKKKTAQPPLPVLHLSSPQLSNLHFFLKYANMHEEFYILQLYFDCACECVWAKGRERETKGLQG